VATRALAAAGRLCRVGVSISALVLPDLQVMHCSMGLPGQQCPDNRAAKFFCGRLPTGPASARVGQLRGPCPCASATSDCVSAT